MDALKADPCKVCGIIEVKLIDGYYYCVECGTQDENVRHTMIQEMVLADGGFSFRKKKKVRHVLKEKKEMSPEWYKWHAYNFILEGLTNELISAGAKESVKMKVLWVWSKYIKEYQNKEELGLSQGDGVLMSNEKHVKGKKKKKKDRTDIDISAMKKSFLFGILYVALNLDDSEIQLSDLLRYAEEGHLSIDDCEKFVPAEIKVELIPDWNLFHRSFYGFSVANKSIMTIFRLCSVPPRTPDLRLLVDRYISELCMPNDFKTLVFSLMQLAPPVIEIDERMFDIAYYEYESIVMSYIVVAFKMCFGLDDDYEVRLSAAVDKANEDNCHLKCYKFGNSEESDRLFSFREWCNFIQFRKIIHSHYYMHSAQAYFLNVDDYVGMDQMCTNNKPPKKIKIGDETAMKLLDKIPLINTTEVIPKSKFRPTTTPLTTNTEIILDCLNQPTFKLLLSEDFTKYSLKYAIKHLHLLDTEGNIIVGVNETKKQIKSKLTSFIKPPLSHFMRDEKVYVKNCDNKNWIKTNQPTLEHIKIIDANSHSDKESDHSYDSNTEAVTNEAEIGDKTKLNLIVKEDLDKKSHILKEEIDTINIFDDDFEDLKELDIKEEVDEDVNNTDNQNTINTELLDITEPIDLQESINYNIDDDLETRSSGNGCDIFFDPQKFDREKTIRELVLAACKKYKAKIPNEYVTKQPKKRKANSLQHKTGESNAKRRKQNTYSHNPMSAADEIDNLVGAYFQNMQNDFLHGLSTQVKSVINKVKKTNSTIQNDTALFQNEAINDSHGNTEEIGNNEEVGNTEEVRNNVEVENNEDNDHDLDQSVSIQFVDDASVRDDETIVNPKFDERTHDIKQLFVEAERDSDIDDLCDIFNDSDLVEILDKKKQVMEKCGTLPPREPRPRKPRRNSDIVDDIPLSILRQEKLSILREKEEKKLANTIYPPLVQSEVKKFQYWMRHFSEHHQDMNEVFHKELAKSHPKSFYFVLNECSLITHSNLVRLYKYVCRLEQRILKLSHCTH